MWNSLVRKNLRRKTLSPPHLSTSIRDPSVCNVWPSRRQDSEKGLLEWITSSDPQSPYPALRYCHHRCPILQHQTQEAESEKNVEYGCLYRTLS